MEDYDNHSRTKHRVASAAGILNETRDLNNSSTWTVRNPAWTFIRVLNVLRRKVASSLSKSGDSSEISWNKTICTVVTTLSSYGGTFSTAKETDAMTTLPVCVFFIVERTIRRECNYDGNLDGLRHASFANAKLVGLVNSRDDKIGLLLRERRN